MSSNTEKYDTFNKCSGPGPFSGRKKTPEAAAGHNTLVVPRSCLRRFCLAKKYVFSMKLDTGSAYLFCKTDTRFYLCVCVCFVFAATRQDRALLFYCFPPHVLCLCVVVFFFFRTTYTLFNVVLCFPQNWQRNC